VIGMFCLGNAEARSRICRQGVERRLDSECVHRAIGAGTCIEGERGLERDAYGLADTQEDFGLHQRRGAGRGGLEDRWQGNALAVARPVSVGVAKALRRGIEALNTLKTVTGQLNLRWDTCLPRIAPIGLP